MTPRYEVGESVAVLHAFHLPREVVRGVGVIERITDADGAPLYWVRGFATARTERVLRGFDELNPDIYCQRHGLEKPMGPYGVRYGGCDACEGPEPSFDDAIAARVARLK